MSTTINDTDDGTELVNALLEALVGGVGQLVISRGISQYGPQAARDMVEAKAGAVEQRIYELCEALRHSQHETSDQETRADEAENRIEQLRDAWKVYAEEAKVSDGHLAGCRRGPFSACTCGFGEVESAIRALINGESRGAEKA